MLTCTSETSSDSYIIMFDWSYIKKYRHDRFRNETWLFLIRSSVFNYTYFTVRWLLSVAHISLTATFRQAQFVYNILITITWFRKKIYLIYIFSHKISLMLLNCMYYYDTAWSFFYITQFEILPLIIIFTKKGV